MKNKFKSFGNLKNWKNKKKNNQRQIPQGPSLKPKNLKENLLALKPSIKN